MGSLFHSQEPHPRSRPFEPRFYGSQGLTHYRVGNPTNDRFQLQAYKVRIFSVSENGENGLGDEGADGAMPPLIFWTRTATADSLYKL